MYQNIPARRCRIHGKALVLFRRWGFTTGFGPAPLTYGDYYCPTRNCGTRKTYKLRPT
jgi:hypothetical protein